MTPSEAADMVIVLQGLGYGGAHNAATHAALWRLRGAAVAALGSTRGIPRPDVWPPPIALGTYVDAYATAADYKSG